MIKTKELMQKIGLCVLALTMGTSLPAATQTPIGREVVERNVNTSDPILKPGDYVHIGVWRQPDFSGEFEVAADGSIGHPLYRAVRVAGVPLSVADDRLRAFLRRYEETPTFTMTARFRVIVSGEVRDPKLYSLAPEVTIAQAVALAGGPTERAQLDQVRVQRGTDQLVVDLAQPGGGGEQAIRSGDHIVVPRRRNFFQEIVVPAASVASGVAGLISLVLLLI
jgi:polysaccharide export outer membrane protein